MFGCHLSVFANKSLSISACSCVYLATVVATLMYGSKTLGLQVLIRQDDWKCSTIVVLGKF